MARRDDSTTRRQAQEPETVDQARNWDRVNRLAVRFGLCFSCASQYAWGVQGGFASVRPPCPECAPLVATLPSPRVNGWRSVTGAANDKNSWPSECVTDDPSTPVGVEALTRVGVSHG